MTAPKAKAQTILLAEYNKRYGEDTTAPLYVLNRTEPRGRIAFSCVGDMGTPVPIIIEPTFIPVDLTLSTQRSNIMNNAAFRRLLNANQIVICDNKSVEQIFETSARARDEFQRLFGSQYVSAGAELDIESDSSSMTSTNSDHLDIDLGNDFLNSLYFRIKNEDESEDDLCNEFLRRMDTLSLDELKAFAPHTSTRPELARMVLESIDELEGE